MFAGESARPEGLRYQPDFISAQEEAAPIPLHVSEIDALIRMSSVRMSKHSRLRS
jgi:hypothetical protein